MEGKDDVETVLHVRKDPHTLDPHSPAECSHSEWGTEPEEGPQLSIVRVLGVGQMKPHTLFHVWGSENMTRAE